LCDEFFTAETAEIAEFSFLGVLCGLGGQTVMNHQLSFIL